MSVVEHWLPIPGWEGIYEVSDLGRVRSVDRVAAYVDGRDRPIVGQLLTPVLNPRTGRRQVYLWRDNKQRTHRVYTLVALAFIGPRPDGREVRHLNGDETDDRAVNLSYGTHSENELDKVRHGTHKEARKTHCKSGHPFAGDNLYFANEGRARKCKICSREYTARYLAKRAERPKAGQIPL